MTVMAKVSTEEICENAKMAREMALTGNYDAAGIYYEGLQQMLGRLVSSVNDPMRKGKWTMVRSNCPAPIRVQSELMSVSSSFRFNSRSPRSTSRSNPFRSYSPR